MSFFLLNLSAARSLRFFRHYLKLRKTQYPQFQSGVIHLNTLAFHVQKATATTLATEKSDKMLFFRDEDVSTCCTKIKCLDEFYVDVFILMNSVFVFFCFVFLTFALIDTIFYTKTSQTARENGLFWVTLWQVLYHLLRYSAEDTTSQVNCCMLTNAFISLKFSAKPIICNLHASHITALRLSLQILTNNVI